MNVCSCVVNVGDSSEVKCVESVFELVEKWLMIIRGLLLLEGLLLLVSCMSILVVGGVDVVLMGRNVWFFVFFCLCRFVVCVCCSGRLILCLRLSCMRKLSGLL